jgi:hypothetical protein
MTPHADAETLSAYLDGEVPSSERAGLERHLASCAECSARKSALEGVIRSVGELPPVTATGAEYLAIRRAVLEASSGRAPSGLGAERGRGPGRSRAWRLFAATAAVAAALGGIVTIVVVRGAGPSPTTTASAPAPSPAPAVPTLANDADVRSYAQSQAQVRTFLGQPQVAAGAPAAPQTAASGSARVPSAFGELAPTTPTAPTAPTTKSAPNADRALPSQSPPTLGSCTRAAVPAGAALLDATPVIYQGTPAWVIAYGTPPASTEGSNATLDRVVVDVRSQSTCSVLDQTAITP